MAEGIMSLAKKVEKKGRNGDTILAHITPQEARLLKMLGGSGSRNPVTGLLEFFGDGGDGGGPSGGDGYSPEPEPVIDPDAAEVVTEAVVEPQGVARTYAPAAYIGGPDPPMDTNSSMIQVPMMQPIQFPNAIPLHNPYRGPGIASLTRSYIGPARHY